MRSSALRVSRKSIWRKDGYEPFIRNGIVQLVGASRFLGQLYFFAEVVEVFLVLYGKTCINLE